MMSGLPWSFLAWLSSLVLAIPAIAQQTSAPVGEWRQWTLDGKTKIEAAMRGVDSGNVILQSRDGRAATLPLARIGAVDRAYVRAAIGGLVMEAVEKANAGPAVSSSLGAAGRVAARSGWQGGVKVDPADCEVTDVTVSGGDWKRAFRSGHFEFSSNTVLPVERQRDVARLFELEYELHRRAGWGVGPRLESGGRTKVQLFDTDAAFAAAGALPLSGCDLDYETGTLRCTLEAAGVHLIEGVWLSDSVMTPKAVARGVTHLVLRDAFETLPLWVINGMDKCMGAIPVAGGTAWPDHAAAGVKEQIPRGSEVSRLGFASLLRADDSGPPPELAEKAAELLGAASGGKGKVPASEVLELLKSKSLEDYAKSRLAEGAASGPLAYYFIFLESEGRAAKLATVIAAARADQSKWDAYDEAVEKYDKEWDALKARKDVVAQGDGRFLLPSTVTAPKEPVPPLEVESREELRALHLSKFLAGAEASAVADAAKAALKSAGF